MSETYILKRPIDGIPEGTMAEYLPEGNGYDGEEGFVIHTGQCEPKVSVNAVRDCPHLWQRVDA